MNMASIWRTVTNTRQVLRTAFTVPIFDLVACFFKFKKHAEYDAYYYDGADVNSRTDPRSQLDPIARNSGTWRCGALPTHGANVGAQDDKGTAFQIASANGNDDMKPLSEYRANVRQTCIFGSKDIDAVASSTVRIS